MDNKKRKVQPKKKVVSNKKKTVRPKKKTVSNKKRPATKKVSTSNKKRPTTKKVSASNKKTPVKKRKTAQKKYVYYRDAQGNLHRRVVKKKRNYKRLRKLILIGGAAIFVLLYTITQRDSIALRKLGYSGKDRKILTALPKSDVQEYLSLDHAIDLSVWNEYSNEKHYYDYELYESKHPDLAEISVIHYVDSFYDIYNELEILGFDKEYCRKHWDTWTIDQYNVFTDNRIDYKTVEKYLAYDECVIEDLPKYVKSDYKGIEAIMHVSYDFIDSNNSTEDVYYIEDSENEGILLKDGFTVNSYEPSDLVECKVVGDPSYSGNFKLTKDAAKNFENLVKAAAKQGYTLLMQDGYLSYGEFENLFDSWAKKYGNVFARTQIGDPGSNEHQTGLAVDISTSSYNDSYEYEDIRQTPDYKWLLEHACEYGFIVRYPQGKDDITGVKGEYDDPAKKIHLRYVGKEKATDIVDMDMTLEEYVLTYGFGYQVSLVESDD